MQFYKIWKFHRKFLNLIFVVPDEVFKDFTNATSARKQGDADLAAVLKESMKRPTRPAKMRKICTEHSQKPIALSADEALAFFLDNNFTKEQYNAIRQESKLRNCYIYPHYSNIIASKLKCRPQAIEANETLASLRMMRRIE